MSNLLEQASLVMIPSGYKEDIVYSVIPTSGAGDLSFTRASNGTRINSAGLVEVCPWNLLQYSEEFDNAYWSKIGVGTGSAPTVTANYGVAPNGTNTADRVVFNTGAGTTSGDRSILRASGLVLNNNGTGSFYIKSNTGSSQSIGFHNGSQIDVKTVTTSWQRYDTFISSSVSFFGLENLGSNSTAGTCDVLVWGGQLNYGDLKPYFPTTDRLNVPRLTYQNGGGGCPSLLLEKQSTNLITYSEQFDLWGSFSDLTVSSNVVTSPDGTQNASKLIENSSNGYHIIGDSNITLLASTLYTTSFFAKASERSYARMLAPTSNYASQSAYFDLTNGNCSATAGTVSTQSMGNGWYRCVWTLTTLSSVSGGIGMWFGPARNMTDAYNTYTGTNGSGIYAWGAQIEQSSYPTSYIVSTSSTATRVADECSKTGISSLIGTEFTAFVDITILPDDGPTRYLVIKGSGGIYANWIGIEKSGSAFAVAITNGSSITVVNLYGGTVVVGQRYKIAIRCKSGQYALYINGTQIQLNTTAFTPSVSILDLHYYDYYGQNQFNQVALFSALTNSELAQLTGNQNYTINQAYASYGVASESPNCVQP